MLRSVPSVPKCAKWLLHMFRASQCLQACKCASVVGGSILIIKTHKKIQHFPESTRKVLHWHTSSVYCIPVTQTWVVVPTYTCLHLAHMPEVSQ